jgi:molybdopterin-guanine dinucleotide biosynthesis protein A
MLGIVLCGGKSTRMGTDKGLLAPDAETWVSVAADKLTDLGLEVKISINKEQLNTYADIFSYSDLIPDDSNLDIHGPLCGVLSVHLQKPAEDLFILACDMPLMESFILKELLQTAKKYPQADSFVFKNDNEPEPLCGIYKASGLASILKMYREKQLAKHSMKFMLDHLNTLTIQMPGEYKPYFQNFNAHADLNGL